MATAWLDNPDRYIYDAVKKGCKTQSTSQEVDAGINDDVRQNAPNGTRPRQTITPCQPRYGGRWSHAARDTMKYTHKLSNGEIHEVNDLITYNLNIRQFAQDVIENCEGPELLARVLECHHSGDGA